MHHVSLKILAMLAAVAITSSAVEAASASDTKTFGTIGITFLEASPRNTTEAEVRNFLPIREGEAYSPAKLDEAIDSLHRWGRFEAINVETKISGSSVDINLFLKEAILIGEIEIAGNYPYIKPKIRKYLTIRPGDIYTRERIDDQLKRIRDFYEREGFLNTTVTSSEKWNEYSADVSVTFKIKYGSVLRYGEMNIEGNHAFPNGRIISYINPLRRYKPRDFNEAIRRANDYYQNHGYPRAYVQVVKKDIDVEKRKINIGLRVKEGPYVKVNFLGNKGFSHRKLKKVVTIFKEGSFDEFELEASKTALIDYYHLHGYPNVQVSFARKDVKDGNIVIDFTVKEGPKETISALDIEGNEVISANKLKKQMKSKELSLFSQGEFNESKVKEDLGIIKNYYGSEGFLNANVGTPEITKTRNGMNVLIPVTENHRSFVQDIILNSDDTLPKKALFKKLKNKIGRPLNPEALKEDKQAVLIFYADHGYPYTDVRQTMEILENGDAVIRYDVQKNTFVKIGEIVIVGNTLTATRSIVKVLSLKEGDPFSYDKIAKSQISLRRLRAFNTVSIETIGLVEKEPIVNLSIKVEEQKPFVLDFTANYSTDLGFGGTVNFVNVNAFGRAKRYNLRLTGGQQLSQGEMAYTDPAFLGSDVEFSTSLWLKYDSPPGFSYLQPGWGFGFFRKYHRTGLAAKFELMRNYFVHGDPTAAAADSLRDNTISKLSFSPSFDTRNSFSEPTRGIYTVAEAALYNEIQGSDANFTKLRAALGQYNGFLKYLIFSNYFRIDRIVTFGNNTVVPINELFQLGGDDTVRGYKEDSLGPVNTSGDGMGGKFRWIYNGELTLKFLTNWRLVGFFDIGALVNSFSAMTWDQVRYSSGPGLRYITPVGPVRVDYGFKLNKRNGESTGRLHLTFGYVF